jgi:hypothetical protein
MNSTWPKAVVDFEAFLRRAGLMCRCRKEFEAFDNKLAQYDNASIGVRVECDRSIWITAVADIAARPDEWYDAAILRDLLVGLGEDVLSFPDQIRIVRMNWPLIVSCFGHARREDTHVRLAILRRERLKRLFPSLRLQ